MNIEEVSKLLGKTIRLASHPLFSHSRIGLIFAKFIHHDDGGYIKFWYTDNEFVYDKNSSFEYIETPRKILKVKNDKYGEFEIIMDSSYKPIKT